MDSKICTATEAVANIQDGAHIAAHYWGMSGTPGYLFRALVERGVKDLTVYINNFLPISEPLQELGYINPTMLLPLMRKVVTAFLGARVFYNMGGDFLGERVKNGELEVEMTTHGVLASRLQAGALGLGGFYSPIGVGTIIEKGKEKRTINGHEYLFEEPICPDVGLVKAYKADTLGNLIYRGTARGVNPIIAMASKFTIAEVLEIVEPGELNPEEIVTPGVYVDRIVLVPDEDAGSWKRRGELTAKVRKLAELRAAVIKRQAGGQS